MCEIWTMGEILVEIMRPRPDMPLDKAAEFLGPFPSGAPAIFIDTVARLGHSGGIIGGIGEDDFGKNVLDRLKKNGVNCNYINTFANRATAVAFVTYFRDGSRKFIFHIDGTPSIMPDFNPRMNIKQTKYFHIMGCSLMTNDHFREEIIKAAKFFFERGVKISFDPNIRPELLGENRLIDIVDPILKRCSILLPGVQELQLLAGKDNISGAIEFIFDRTPIELIILKYGKNGAAVHAKDECIKIPVYSINEVDPTGAGDAFDAGFLCGLLEGKSLRACGDLAAAAGALNAAAFGPMEGDISVRNVQTLIEKNI
jgi:sugar/nucleoside kinase (ribokinase family)